MFSPSSRFTIPTITLATDIKQFKKTDDRILIPDKTKFLVVDGQHRLWAQKFSQKDGQYACIIHLGKTEKEMAELFLEINENQRRVPSSLRWDLVRLVHPAGDESAIMASELVLTTSSGVHRFDVEMLDLVASAGREHQAKDFPPSKGGAHRFQRTGICSQRLRMGWHHVWCGSLPRPGSR